MSGIIDLCVKEKIYKNKKSQISILNDFRLEVAAGEKIAIVGESGAGKSSLLNIIGLLDRNMPVLTKRVLERLRISIRSSARLG